MSYTYGNQPYPPNNNPYPPAYPPAGGGGGDQISSGFNEALGDQQEAYQLSTRNKLDDLHNKAVLKGIDNAAGYI